MSEQPSSARREPATPEGAFDLAAAGTELAEHASPGAATLQVLQGRAVLAWADERLAVGAGSWATIPDQDHALHADEDTVVLLTVARDAG